LRKLNLQDWAAVAEIFGTMAVVVSLVFVVQGLSQNTKALQKANLNNIYDRSDSLNGDILANPALASYYVEEVFGVNNLSAEEAQFAIVMRRELNQWEQFYTWQRNGVIDGGDWNDWDANYSEFFSKHFPEEWWNGIKTYYYADFSSHVDSVYER
jgi:hypothetical protein